jgi:SAM-dependent methyltransferase
MTETVGRVLAGAATGTPLTKLDFILGHCRGRRVLDVGCVQHTWEQSHRNPNWLHQKIRKASATCVGVDYLAHDVERLRELGYDIVVGDVLSDEPPGTFEVVVLGDLIEHLENPVRLLEYAAAALEPDGIAIVTTPNATYLGQFVTVLARRRPEINPEHVVIFDPFTFRNLVDRSPLELQELVWLRPSWPALWDSRSRVVRKVVSPAVARLTTRVLRRRPYLSSDFGAILRRREMIQTSTPEERASAAVAYHGPRRRGLAS